MDTSEVENQLGCGGYQLHINKQYVDIGHFLRRFSAKRLNVMEEKKAAVGVVILAWDLSVTENGVRAFVL